MHTYNLYISCLCEAIIMNKKVFYHTRHIPIEHLKLDHPFSKKICENLLCESIDTPCVDKLCDYGIDIVETRLVWSEMEPEPGKFDFSRLDRDIAKIKSKGLGVGIFPWFQHPPKWYSEGTRLKCPEHGKESSLISIWDSDRLLQIYDRLYCELAKRYRDSIDFIYVGIYSDYGEVCMPLGVSHYVFSPEHICRGSMWDADSCAMASKAKALKNNNSIMNYAEWYTNTLMNFTDKVCAIVRKYFPTVRAALPIGCVGEKICNGQIKSISAKIAAKYNITARWTGWCLDGKYELSNIGTRRVSTAAKFYGADFGLETPLYLNENTAQDALFEVLSNNTSIIHNDPGNIFRAYDIYKPMHDYSTPVPFIADKAVFYPLEGEQLGKIDFYDEYRLDCAKLRRYCDFEVADSIMLKDGYKNDLIFTPNAPILLSTANMIKDLGLNVIYCNDAPPIIIETKEKFIYGTPIKDFSALGNWDGKYKTQREDCSVIFDTNLNKILYN